MNPFIFHLFGPFAISWYGVLVVLGVSLFLYYAYSDMRRSAILSTDQFLDCAAAGIIGGLVGGKLLFLVSEYHTLSLTGWQDVAGLLVGGFAILGAMIGAIVGVVVMARSYRIELPALFDLVGAYALLAHGIARLGCLIAGCCYGIPADRGIFSVTYSHPASLGPLHIALFPSQLVMSAVSLIGFVICLRLYQMRGRREGLVFCVYIIWEAASRFLIDFLRGDRVSFVYGLSVYQWIAFGMVAMTAWFLWVSIFDKRTRRRW